MSTFATPSPSKISRYSRYGSWQVLAEAQFQRGLVTDTVPVALPAGAVADVRDYLFDRPGKIRKRGGSVYASVQQGSSTGMSHVANVAFGGGNKLIAVSTAPAITWHAWDTTSGAAADLGALANSVTQPPIFYNDRLYLLTGSNTAPGRPAYIAVSGGGSSSLHDSLATFANVGCVHAGYLVLANDGVTHQNRLWFGPLPDPETAWDTLTAYIDTNGPITGLASIQGVLIVFHRHSCERVLGSIPPGTVGENMSLQPLSGQGGSLDPGSICSIGGNVYFADDSGMWVTNGASVTSVTSRADGTGISALWRSTISAASLFNEKSVRAGTFGNDYIVAQIMHRSGSSWSCDLTLVYHVATGVWSRFTLEPISGYSPAVDTLETYAAPTNQGRLIALSQIFAEAPANAADADGTVIQPSVTSRVMGQGPFEKAWGDGHLTYDMRSSSGATLVLTYSRDIEQQTFQPSATFAGVTVPTRQRFPVSGDGHGFSWTIAQTGASTKTELYAVELEHRNYEEQADG